MRRFTQQLSVYLLCFLIGIFVTQYWSLPSEGKNKNSQKVTKPSRGQDISDGEAILREERVRNSEDIKIVEDEIEEADVLKVADNQDKQIHQGHIPKDRPEKEKIVKVQEQQQKHEKRVEHPKPHQPEKPNNVEPAAKQTSYEELDFSECERLPSDRMRKITVPSADATLRQEIAKLKIKTYLPKTVFRNPKMLFFAGLEGTGHHLIDGTFKDLCTMVSEIVVSKCRAATNVIPNYIGNIGFKWDFRRLSENQSQHAPFLTDIKTQYKLTKEVMFLNSMRHHSNIFLDAAVSYPDGGHPRIDNFPDVRFLAEILSPKYDFNVILMLRDIDSLLVSTVLHRAFEPNFYNQAHIFEFMLELLVSQLSKLDPKFIIGCIKLDASPTIMRSNLKQIDQNLNSTFISFEEQVMKHWRFKPEGACIHPDDLDPKLMYRLVVLNQKLHSFCPK